MYESETMIQSLFQALNILICESKIARSYGTGHKLTHSDISLLNCVRNNEGAKASDLSQYLGMTNGAVAQLAKKLEAKGYVKPYRIAGNKKEVYYRLTDSGETACKGCDEHYREMTAGIRDYVHTLDGETLSKLTGLFSVITDTAAVAKNCSIKQAAARKSGQSSGTAIKRCKRCQRLY